MLYGHEYGSESEREELQETKQCSEKQVVPTVWNYALFFFKKRIVLCFSFSFLSGQLTGTSYLIFINVVASRHCTTALQSSVNICGVGTEERGRW